MKNKAPSVALTTERGDLCHAIAHVTDDKPIVSESWPKGKAHDDLLQLQHEMQKVREVRIQEDPALPLQELQAHVL